MTDVSLRTLSIAIGSIVADREHVLSRIASEGTRIDQEEHLSELVMDMDRAPNELAELYEAQRKGAAGYPSYDELVAAVTNTPDPRGK